MTGTSPPPGSPLQDPTGRDKAVSNELAVKERMVIQEAAVGSDQMTSCHPRLSKYISTCLNWNNAGEINSKELLGTSLSSLNVWFKTRAIRPSPMGLISLSTWVNIDPKNRG